MLGHPHRDRRQLGDLVARRFRSVNPLSLTEEVSARAAALRPTLDDLVDLLERKQPTVPALMPKLAAPTPPRPLPRPDAAAPTAGPATAAATSSASSGSAAAQARPPGLEPLVRLDQL